MDRELATGRWLPQRLPAIAGRLRWPFVVLWSVTLAIALFGSVLALVSDYQYVTGPASIRAAVGIAIAEESPARPYPTIGALVEPYGTQVGLHAGDRLVAIDNRAAGTDDATIDGQLSGPPGAALTLTTRAPSGSLSSHVLTRNPERYHAALRSVGLSMTSFRLAFLVPSFLFPILTVLACAIVLMVRRARDPLAPWASLMMLWLVIGQSDAGVEIAQYFGIAAVVMVTVSWLAVAFLIVVLSTFPEGRFEPRWSLAVAALAIVMGVFCGQVVGIVQANLIVMALTVAAIGTIIARYRRIPLGVGRQQIRWALLGFGTSVVFLALVIITTVGLQEAAEIGLFSWLFILRAVLSSCMITALIVSITVALLRYRLYDADATISRSIVYGALTLLLLAIFAGSEKVIEILGEGYFGEQLGALAGGLSAAVAAVCIGPLHHRVTHWAEHRFRSGLTKLRQGLPQLMGDMREIASPAKVADAMLARVEQGVRARHGAVLIDHTALAERNVSKATVVAWIRSRTAWGNDFSRLQVDRADEMFPVRMPLRADGARPIGWLLLGPRPDGSLYSREERAALHNIAEPVARALAISIERQARDDARRDQDDARDREVERLGGLVEQLRAHLGLDTSSSRREA